MMKLYALVSPQGTACSETVLTEQEYTPGNRADIERQFCDGRPDAPVPGTWQDVSENDYIRGQFA
jgi:hypothetical protein